MPAGRVVTEIIEPQWDSVSLAPPRASTTYADFSIVKLPRLILQLRTAPFLAIWVLAFLYRVAVLIRFSHSPDFVPNGDDMKFYHDWALQIMNGRWTDGHAFYGLPGYAYASAAIFSVFPMTAF